MAQEITFTKQADGTWQGSFTSTGTRTIVQVQREENAPLYINISADNGQHNVVYQPPKNYQDQILCIDIAEGVLVTVVSHSAVTKAQYIASSLDYYTKDEIDDKMEQIHQFEPVVASSLPTASADTMYKFYFIPKQSAGEQTNTKEEWMTVKEGSSYRWEKIGETDVDLSDYVTVDDLEEYIENSKSFKGWFDSSSALSAAYPSPKVGDYAYIKGASASDPAAIYECATAGTWSDSGRTVDTSSVQTFATGEEVNDVHIVDDLTTGGADDVLSAEQGKVLNEKFVKIINVELVDNCYYNTAGNNIPPAPTNSSSVWSSYAEVQKGDIVEIFGKGGGSSSYRFYALIYHNKVDGTYTKVSESGLNIDHTTTPALITIPDGVNGIAINYYDYANNGGTAKIYRTIDNISEYQDILSYINKDKSKWVVDEYDKNDLSSGYILPTTGVISSNSYSHLLISNIPPHSFVKLRTVGGSNALGWIKTDRYGENVEYSEENLLAFYTPVFVDFTEGGILFVNTKSSATSSKTFNVKVYTDTSYEIDTPTTSRKYINNPFPMKDTIKILGIGNSYLNNSVAYIDEFMSAADVDSSRYCVYTITASGKGLDYWVSGTPSSVTARAAGSLNMGITSSANIDAVLANDWDLIVLQQYSGDAIDYSTFNPYLTQLVSKIRQFCTNKKVCIGFNMSWPYSTGSNSYGGYPKGVDRYNLICEATKKMVINDGIDFIIPTGTAIENVRATSLNEANTYDMSKDGTHLAPGIALYVAAGVWVEQVFSRIFNVSVLGSTAIHTLTTDEASENGAQDVDLTNALLCQKCSFFAVMNMYEISEIEE